MKLRRYTAAVRLAALAFAAALSLAPRFAAAHTIDHAGAAVGGGVGGLLCGGGTLLYAQFRGAGRESRGDDPILWHQTEGPGVLAAFFAEHAAAGGITGAFGDGPRAGFVIGGAVTCTLDVAWIITSEVIAANAEPSVALVQRDGAGWRLRPPPVAIRRDGAYVSLLAIRF